MSPGRPPQCGEKPNGNLKQFLRSGRGDSPPVSPSLALRPIRRLLMLRTKPTNSPGVSCIQFNSNESKPSDKPGLNQGFVYAPFSAGVRPIVGSKVNL